MTSLEKAEFIVEHKCCHGLNCEAGTVNECPLLKHDCDVYNDFHELEGHFINKCVDYIKKHSINRFKIDVSWLRGKAREVINKKLIKQFVKAGYQSDARYDLDTKFWYLSEGKKFLPVMNMTLSDIIAEVSVNSALEGKFVPVRIVKEKPPVISIDKEKFIKLIDALTSLIK